MDICDYILHDHDEQRRLFAILDEVPREDADALGAIWGRLANLLEVHAQAEEELFYPRLLQVGKGEGDKDSAEDETLDAVEDHDDIREGVRAAEAHEVGTQDWWDAVYAARKANDDHMGEEEREALPDFRHHASAQERHDMAVRFAVYEAKHADGRGVDASERGAQAYVDAHS
ncbi:hemerythrin domain-containing protein [uncultured Pseudokineococcus sp.]|uniref:hemerythrin domain-containing protein n=1 Tax=uncultured Pseudokineococcus sp. TaxID=1642928 RepID=UPI002633BA76|nr:hemerythrin domain-containing protein [uncultured Pseudokineococcus sp.]